MEMRERVVMASKFKEQCLALLDQVERTKVTVIVTKRGRPVAQLVPLPVQERRGTMMGSVRLLEKDEGAYFSTGEAWTADDA